MPHCSVAATDEARYDGTVSTQRPTIGTCSTRTRSSAPSTSTRNWWTSEAGIHTAPSRAEIASAGNHSGSTASKAATFGW